MGFLERLPLGRLHRRMPWWMRVALAVVAIVLGAVIVLRPTTALDVLAWLIGGGMVLTGVLEFTGRGDDEEEAEEARTRQAAPTGGGQDAGTNGTRRRWRAWTGAAWLVGGVLVLLLPGLTVRLVAVLVGVLLIASGAWRVVSAFRRSRTWDERIADAAFGIAGIVFGVLALSWPDITLLVTAVVFGARLVMDGIVQLWNTLRRHRQEAAGEPRRRRWGRTAVALMSLVLALGAVVATAPLREGSTVIDDFYAAPRDAPDEPGRLVRAEPFTRDVPGTAKAWRILYTTTGVDGEVRVASGLVMVPATGDGSWPVIDWNHGTTGFARHCAPTLQERPLWSGALYVARSIIAEGWAIVATDYIGLGTEGPHPYLIGPPTAYASLDAVRAAQELEEADLSTSTVVWGHSQGGGAALWSGALAPSYAPGVLVRGVAALAPASDPEALVEHVTDVTGGSIFASFAFEAFSEIYPDITYRDYIRPGAEPIVRAMAERCLSDPATVVSVLAALGMSSDPPIFARNPATGPLGAALADNVPPPTVAAPLLIAQGGNDSVVLASSQDAFVARQCAAGEAIDYRVYAGYEHVAVVERPSPLLDDLFEWTRARFAGERVDQECTRTDVSLLP